MRVILECEEGRLFIFGFVGALNVGQMVFEFENPLRQNCDTKR